MTKQQLIDRVHRSAESEHGLTKKAVAGVVDSIFAELGDYFVRGRLGKSGLVKFTYPSFGTFTKRRRSERRARNPRTNAVITIPPAVTLAFSPSRDLRELLNEKN
jgi:nucleoid DNA-binding protein